MKLYRFARLIQKYYTDIEVQIATEGYWDDETGEYVPSKNDPVTLKAAVIPMSSQQIYNSGGSYTTADRNIFILEPLTPKTKVTHKGLTYSVEQSTDFTEYGDFFMYVLKAVSTFDRVQ